MLGPMCGRKEKKGETYMNNVDIVRVVLQNSILSCCLFWWGANENPCVQLSKFTQTKNAALNLSIETPISKVFLDHQNIFFFTVGQNCFGNKIPFLSSYAPPHQIPFNIKVYEPSIKSTAYEILQINSFNLNVKPFSLTTIQMGLEPKKSFCNSVRIFSEEYM